MSEVPQQPDLNGPFGDQVREEIAKSKQREFIVSIMGQTGVGKTSLLKALFNKVILDDWPVDDVRPATMQPKSYTLKAKDGQTLIVNDLPGIGESSDADKTHMNTYEDYFQRSDIILWAMHSDSRATTFDAESLKNLLERYDEQTRINLMSKLIFVLTKVDTLLPAPWIMFYNKQKVRFEAEAQIRAIIQQKQDFLQRQLILPFGRYIVSRTHNDANFVLDESFRDEPDKDQFRSDENFVWFHGLLTQSRVDELSKKHGRYQNSFKRLYENYEPVACSALFKYNLSYLMLIILNKLDSVAAQNFKAIVNTDRLEHMSLDEARRLCNLLIRNVSDNRKIFDLEEGYFPDPRNDSAFYNGNSNRTNRRGIIDRFIRNRR